SHICSLSGVGRPLTGSGMQAHRARSAVFVVNGSDDSALARRAHALARGLGEPWRSYFLYRRAGSRLRAALTFLSNLRTFRPELIYVLDMAASGVTAALPFRLLGTKAVIIDTGDAITALARAGQLRGPAGLAATWFLEESGLRLASHIVVRGYLHHELLT